MTKPQATFPDQANNDPSYVWRPTLAYKAHAMVPLGHINPAPPMPKQKIQDASDELRKIQDREWDRYKRACKQRAHPYFFETEHLPYPTRMFEIAPPIPPRPLDQQEAILVDTSEALSKMTEALKASKEIAVDLEYHSSRSYYGFTCLMQISTREEDFIVDTLKLRGELREDKLGGVMADPNIVKVSAARISEIIVQGMEEET
jgi:exosome complex exonuclease RRP6